jgi:HTH-type transcriptional regulator, competence development regulator
MNPTGKNKKPTAADVRRALHEVALEDGLVFPEKPEDVASFEARIDESKVPTPDVNEFRRFLRRDKSQAQQTADKVVAFPAPVHASTKNATMCFGDFVGLMRRKRGWTISQLARSAEADENELTRIERDPSCEPELSTVHGLAKTFGLPPKKLIVMSGLGEARSAAFRHCELRFAAPLTEEEEMVLQTYLKVALESSQRK